MTARRNTLRNDHHIGEEHRLMTRTPSRRLPMLARRTATVLTLAVLGGAATAPAASAVPFDVNQFSVSQSTTQAGAHADLNVTLDFQLGSHPVFPFPDPTQAMSTVEVALPEGFMGDAARFPACPVNDFMRDATLCPADAQVGVVALELQPLFGPIINANEPVYNVAPSGGEPAKLGFSLSAANVLMEVAVRSGGDYGLTTTVRSIPNQGVFTKRMELTLWGDPASHGTGGPPEPFMTNPTDCTRQLTSRMRVRTYADPNTWISREDTLPAPTGCGAVPFAPTLTVRAENPIVDKPSAVQVDIGIPQSDDPTGLTSAALKQAIVAMPEGMTINPSLAHERVSCGDSAFGLRNGGAVTCPQGSKIGTVSVNVPALRAPLPGDIYLGDPQPGNPFRLFVLAEGQGVRVKLLGSIVPHPETGRITAIFENTPQVGFRSFSLRFLGGERAALLMPRKCGTGTAVASFTPYSSSSAAGAVASIWTIGDAAGNACPETTPFEPPFTAGVTGAEAGKDTGMTVAFGRPDGHQVLSKLKLHLPAGLLGRLAAFPLCPNDQANAGTCSEDSLVGSTMVSAGSGGSPLNLPGRVYLTEPPRAGQIAGLSIVVPAIAGPYDLGKPVVRAGITVNPDTSLTIESDPLPTMLQGVELRIKQVIVNVDAPGFMFNPSDCSPKTITGSITSTDGTEVPVASPFGVRNCAALPFEPQITTKVSAPQGQQKISGLELTIRPRAGDANMRVVNLILPAGLGARLEGPLQHPCLEEELGAGECPEASHVGEANALTPILPQELRGPVYLLENASGTGGLPRLLIRLRGAVNLDLVGDITVNPQGRLVAAVPGVPDVPISEFHLSLPSGEQSPLTGAAVLCTSKPVVNRQIIAHNGRQSSGSSPVTVTGCSSDSSASKSKKGKKGKAGKKGARSL